MFAQTQEQIDAVIEKARVLINEEKFFNWLQEQGV